MHRELEPLFCTLVPQKSKDEIKPELALEYSKNYFPQVQLNKQGTDTVMVTIRNFICGFAEKGDHLIKTKYRK